MRVLVGITGGIAAYKAAILVRLLKQAGHEVQVVMTTGAQAFITPLTLQALSGEPVHTTLLDEAAEAGMGHIALARWAQLVLVAPASADTLARLAAGMADDLLATVVLATPAPIWLAPAMNQQMWASPAVQRNIRQLQDYGYHIIMPDSGVQACGDVGAGRLPEPEQLAEQVNLWQQRQQAGLSLPNLQGRRLILTAGPTREALDPVRYVSNHSSGKMGFALAAAAAQAGAEVVLITGPVALATPPGVTRVAVTSAEEMLQASLQYTQQPCDAFIATAAVADYRSAATADHKIKKSGETFQFEMVRNPDIVATIAALSIPQRPTLVMGFAAETQQVETYAQGKLVNKKLDLIACNDVSRQDIGFGADENAMTVYFASRFGIAPLVLDKASKHLIAVQLLQGVAQALSVSQAQQMQ